MVERLRGGDVRALARAISMVEDAQPGARELLAACEEFAGQAVKIGITGPPGAGKSTLVDQMAQWLEAHGEKVGVLAIDPTSPYTGGALLGDRIRMREPVGNSGIYVRSMASRGAVGGLADAVRDACKVLEASGRSRILIETVGVGQDEVEIARLADVTVLVLVPGMGDDVQSMKAGVMEIADVFAVNKSDCDGADRVVAEILAMQGLSGSTQDRVSVVQTVATTGNGIDELMAAVAQSGERKKVRLPAVAGTWSRGLRVGQADIDALDLDPLKSDRLDLDHLGVAVRSIAAAGRFYEMLGLKVAHEEIVEHEQVKVAMLPVGNSRVELLEPTVEDSVIGRFLTKRGEGLHHIAVRVGDVDGMFEKLKESGVRLVSEQVRTGAGGHRYFFVHPSSTGGVLVEIVGKG
ncbi:methylmalonyl Co-A mutase-associated GTPase MeaB [Edaphobacter sp. HDX4]|uniref:methylmalonyl Co-A mutase-associated GTPase MeaB n=1 Tax=Edaphobacter sp. HDX4 TaxID=2794064 RepID=UPI002FE676CF